MVIEQVTTLRILMEKKSGLLSQIVRTLVKRGLIMESQRVADTNRPGHAVVSVFFRGNVALRADDLNAVKNINPSIREVKVIHPEAAASIARAFNGTRFIPESAFFSFLTNYYPNIVHLVTEYKNILPSERRASVISSLGQNFGIREYQTKYSRGNPLSLELTIKRMLQPALSPLVKVQVDGHSVTVENCPFCREYISADAWECNFLHGYILGFLRENPKEPAVEVDQICSVAKGDGVCLFEVH